MRERTRPRTIRYANRRWIVLATRAHWLFIERKGVAQWIPAACANT